MAIFQDNDSGGGAGVRGEGLNSPNCCTSSLTFMSSEVHGLGEERVHEGLTNYSNTCLWGHVTPAVVEHTPALQVHGIGEYK